MTDEEIRIKVAEVMGWTVVQDEHGVCGTIDGIHWHSPAGFLNYPESLDACAEFEKDAPREYWRKLSASVEPVDSSPIGLAIAVAKATARQRCITFLKMKGILP